MPYLRLFFLMLFCLWFRPLQAQDNYVETIYIVTNRDTEPDTLGVSRRLPKSIFIAIPISDSANRIQSRDEFYRTKSVLRMELYTPANRGLRYADPQEGIFKGQNDTANQKGVINLLLEGFKREAISAYGPLGQAGYTFDSLRRDLMILEGIDPSQGRDMGLDEIGGESLSKHLDILGNRRINTGGHESFEIQLFRLIWHNPNTIEGMHAVAIFPYKKNVELILNKMTMEMRQHSGFSMSVNKFFDSRMYMATPVDIHLDPLRYLHVRPPRIEVVPLGHQLKPEELSKKD